MHTDRQPPDGQAADGRPVPVSERRDSTLEAGLGFRIGRTHRAIRVAWEARIADLGLSSPQAGVLRAVCEQPGSSLRELARRLRTDPMNAKRLADGLQEAGLLASVGDPADRRRRVLRPTAAGQALSREIEGRALEWSATLEAIIGRNDVVQLSMTLTRIEDGIAGLPGYEPPGGEAGHG